MKSFLKGKRILVTGAAGTGNAGGYPGIVGAEAGKGGELASGRFMTVRAGNLFIRPT